MIMRAETITFALVFKMDLRQEIETAREYIKLLHGHKNKTLHALEELESQMNSFGDDKGENYFSF